MDIEGMFFEGLTADLEEGLPRELLRMLKKYYLKDGIEGVDLLIAEIHRKYLGDEVDG